MLLDLPDGFETSRGFEVNNVLKESLSAYNLTYFLHSEVIGLYKNGDIGIQSDNGIQRIHALKVIVATGASESSIAFPGWTLPGVMTVGAAQKLLNKEYILPGKKTLLYGTSDLSLETALLLAELDVDVRIIEKSAEINSKNKALKTKLYAANIPLHFNTKVIGGSGDERIEKIQLQKINSESELVDLEVEVDAVCIDAGRHPILDVVSSFGVKIGFNQSLGGWLPYYDLNLKTTNESVYVAGNIAGITSQGAVLLMGSLAGQSVVDELTGTSKQITDSIYTYWKELHRMESTWNKHIWEERISFMAHYMEQALQTNPSDWMCKEEE